MDETLQFSFSLEQQEDFAFLVRFDKQLPPLLTDESPPVGKGAGPDPVRLLAAGVANCLSASLLFALRKYKNQPGTIVASVTTRLKRNEHGRLRVDNVSVLLQIESPAEMLGHLDQVLEQFEDFCTVTESVRSGFPVSVTVRDSSGRVLK